MTAGSDRDGVPPDMPSDIPRDISAATPAALPAVPSKDIPKIRVYRKNKNAVLPRYATEGAAGADVEACTEAAITLQPGERVKIPTGLVLEIAPGWEAQVRPRSGLALKQGVTVLNAPGTIDSDYRGELEILLVNLGSKPHTVHSGERIAQLVFAPAPRVMLEETDKPAPTGRGGGGFGSTGMGPEAAV